VQSVTVVFKHLYPNPKATHYEVGSPMALCGIMYPPGQTDVMIKWGNGPEGEVVVRRKDKSQVSLKAALETAVCKLWPEFLPEDWDN